MSGGPQVRLLSDHVANKIAAGEVVERPASVFKELIENAIDAGATEIQIDMVVGGRKSLVITDNGCGMSRDDAMLCIERHATSKIRDVDDIEAIATLGFRGEAVPAIASVSRFHLVTRPRGAESGTEIIIAGGTLQEVNEVGCPVGTRIAVRNLFYNVPARRKFLRAEQTEAAHIRHMFLVYALAHSGIALRLVSDEREWYRLPAALQFEDRLRDLYSREFVAELRPASCSFDGVQVQGLVGPPTLHRRDRSEQFVCINGRPATAPLVANGISEGFRNTLPKGRQPVVFLQIDLAPDLVDVNVHPTKREVRFRNGTVVRDAVIGAIARALRGGGEVGTDGGTSVATAVQPPPAQPFRPAPEAQVQTLPYPEAVEAQSDVTPQAAEPLPGTSEAEVAELEAPWKHCRVIEQLGRFTLLETEDGLVIMQPQAALERVLFERFMDEIQAQRIAAQGLLQPEAVTLEARQAQVLRQHLEGLQELGFGVAEFGGDTLIVDAVPALLGEVSVTELLALLAGELEAVGTRAAGARLIRDRVARVACRASAVRRTMRREELQRLVEDLGRCRMPYTCPHGHPTLIFMGLRELERKFGIRN